MLPADTQPPPRRPRRRWLVVPLVTAGAVLNLLLDLVACAQLLGAPVVLRPSHAADVLIYHGEDGGDHIDPSPEQIRPAGGAPFITLPGASDVYRVPDGWLEFTVGSTLIPHSSSGAYLVHADGTRTTLFGGCDLYSVAPDGRHLAWQVGRTVTVGRLSGGRIVDRRRHTVPTGLDLHRHTGTAVLETDSGSGTGRHLKSAVWLPSTDTETARTDPTPLRDTEPTPDGRWLIATDDPGCLLRLDTTAGLRTVARRCLPDNTFARNQSHELEVSPDGRHLAVGTDAPTSGSGQSVDVFRMDTLFGTGRPVARYPAQEPDVSWSSNTTVAVGSEESEPDTRGLAVRIHHLGSGRTATVRPPPGAPGALSVFLSPTKIRPVHRYGSTPTYSGPP